MSGFSAHVGAFEMHWRSTSESPSSPGTRHLVGLQVFSLPCVVFRCISFIFHSSCDAKLGFPFPPAILFLLYQTMPLCVESGSNCTRLGSIARKSCHPPCAAPYCASEGEIPRNRPWSTLDPCPGEKNSRHWTANPTSHNGEEKLSKPNPPATFSPNFPKP